MSDMVNAILTAQAMLKEHNIEIAQIKMPKSVYQALHYECAGGLMWSRPPIHEPDSIRGIVIVIQEEPG
jgi:hypothetical protein